MPLDARHADATDTYAQTRARVAEHFDRTAHAAWARLTAQGPVSRIRQTVRAGRDRMRATMLAELPDDLRGARVLDAGCGPGQMAAELAARGADVLGVDVSPRLVALADARLPQALRPRVRFVAGDMLDASLGRFDFTVAMDSLIYYDAADIAAALAGLSRRTGRTVFTVAPRTPLLMAMWGAGRLFPKADRAPAMVPHTAPRLADALRRAGAPGGLREVGRVAQGFYISTCLTHGGAR